MEHWGTSVDPEVPRLQGNEGLFVGGRVKYWPAPARSSEVMSALNTVTDLWLKRLVALTVKLKVFDSVILMFCVRLKSVWIYHGVRRVCGGPTLTTPVVGSCEESTHFPRSHA